ncbi:MAG: NAD-binding protein, partial [Anaerolineae bacterium]
MMQGRGRRLDFWQSWRASWRDTLLLLRDFRGPILFFVIAIGGGGLLYFYLAQAAGEGLGSPAEAVYVVLTMVFLQTGGVFPHTWFLQVFYFLMPVIGIGILAQGLAEFGVLFFNRRARSKEWEMAVASTLNNHVVLVGLGHLGYRVLVQLREMNREVAVIEREPDHDLLADVQRMGIPVLQGDASREAMLDAAGIKRARVLVLCTQNDNLNLQMAIKARTLN